MLELELTRLSTVEIDPTVFEVPANFSLVERIRQEPVPPLVIRLKQAYEGLKHRNTYRGVTPPASLIERLDELGVSRTASQEW